MIESVDDAPWRRHAACKGSDDPRFFGTVVEQRELAVEICKDCPVIGECAEQGRREPDGLWGGRAEGAKGRPRMRGKRSHVPAESPVHGCKCNACVKVRAVEDRARRQSQRHANPVQPETVAKVLEQVCDDWSVTVADLQGSGGSRGRVVPARWDAMVRLRGLGLSSPAIGRVVCRDHATVLYGLRRAGEEPE